MTSVSSPLVLIIMVVVTSTQAKPKSVEGVAGKDDIKNILSELLAQCQEMIDTIRTMYSGILPPIASGGSDSSGHARSGDQSREGIPPPGTTGSGDQSVEGIHPPGTTGSGDQSGEGIPSTGYPRNQKLLNALESACLMTMLGKQKRQFGQPGRVSPPCRYLKQALDEASGAAEDGVRLLATLEADCLWSSFSADKRGGDILGIPGIPMSACDFLDLD